VRIARQGHLHPASNEDRPWPGFRLGRGGREPRVVSAATPATRDVMRISFFIGFLLGSENCLTCSSVHDMSWTITGHEEPCQATLWPFACREGARVCFGAERGLQLPRVGNASLLAVSACTPSPPRRAGRRSGTANYWMRPRRVAYRTTSTVLRSPSFCRRLVRCVSTVAGLIDNRITDLLAAPAFGHELQNLALALVSRSYRSATPSR